MSHGRLARRGYVVTVNAGFGAYESQYDQSLAVLDTRSGALTDFPDARTLAETAKQTLYSDWHSAATASTSTPAWARSPTRSATEKTPPAAALSSTAWRWKDCAGAPDSSAACAIGSRENNQTDRREGRRQGSSLPASIAVLSSAGHEKLLVAGNLSDDVLLLDAATGAIEKRFDLSESNAIPGTYPIALAVTKDEARAYVALWNASEIVELDLKQHRRTQLALLKPHSAVAPGTHPCALEFSPDGRMLYVALSNRDALPL